MYMQANVYTYIKKTKTKTKTGVISVTGHLGFIRAESFLQKFKFFTELLKIK